MEHGDYKGKFARRLSAQREELRLSQAELAQATRRSRQTIIAYESGVSLPSADFFASLHGLDFDILELITGVSFEALSCELIDWSVIERISCRLEEHLRQNGKEVPPEKREGVFRSTYKLCMTLEGADAGQIAGQFAEVAA